ncbi:MAG TPA: cell wall-binding repeat-containing protein, partial [Streptosporangiaceae bacterium]|nr:cell wall-binding repeat-containing protein [Streptosporangiaceae bacterium]
MRLAGADRYGTAAAISAATFPPGVATVFLVTDAGYADALTAGAAAGIAGAPVLIVQPGSIPPATAQELHRLQPRSVVIVGGTAAISDAVRAAAGTYTTGAVTREAGNDRYATAVALSQAAFAAAPAAAAYLATGMNFPDALAGGVAAALAPGPLLLVPATCVPSDVRGEIARLGVSNLVVLGGPAAVDPAVESLAPCPPAAAPTSGSGCVLSGGAAPAFCDTFDQPMGTGNRSGQLNGTVWGVSRISDDYNIGQSQYDVWFPSTSSVCNTAPVNSPNDVQVCNGQFAETSNDGHQFGCNLGCGDQTVLAAYPKQPFDFAGRTGHVVFDLGDDSQGIHAAWPAFAITDLPTPAPYGAPLPGMQGYARNSFVMSMAENPSGQPNGGCPGVDQAMTTQDYVPTGLTVQPMGCVTPGSPTALNHFEIDVSLHEVDVYATNAGAPASSEQLIDKITGFTMPLTRGLIWLEDVHYNACKFNSQCNHTFVWDNVGFDGPVLPRDLSFDVPDGGTPSNTAPGAVNLGWP